MNNIKYAEFARINLPFNIPTSSIFNTFVLGTLFSIFLIIYVIIGSVLWYHWNKYGMNSKGIIFGRMLFVIVSMVLFATSLSGLLYF